MSKTVRTPACPGRFYPSDADELRGMVRSYLDEADVGSEVAPEAVIAPHAGYVFSGPVAGHAFDALRPIGDRVERVVVVGPSHFVPVSGLAAPSHDAFETPLGTVPVDRETVDELAGNLVEIGDEPHRREHSLETHVPFLQVVLGDDFEVVPVVTGREAGDRVAELLEATWEDESTVVSVSSDLSHYLDYESAREVDAATRRSIEAFDADAIENRQACGHAAIRGLLREAAERGLEVETLEMCNSGDTAGDRSEVVGYGAWVFGT